MNKELIIVQNHGDFSLYKFSVIIKCGTETQIIEKVHKEDLKQSDRIVSQAVSVFKSIGNDYTVERKIDLYERKNFVHLWQAEKFVKEFK